MFDLLSKQIKGNNDILMTSEIKLDESFPISQFQKDRHSPTFRFDRNGTGGVIMVFVSEDIPAKFKGSEFWKFLWGIKFKRYKWSNNYSYNSYKTLTGENLKLLSKNLDLQPSKCECFHFLGDFNVRIENDAMQTFSNLSGLTSLNNKNGAYSFWIDLMLTNCPKYFQNTIVIETRLSDFHKTIVTIMKKTSVNWT